MKLREYAGWELPGYSPLRDPARGVIKAYQDAARQLDALQEYVYIEAGLIHTAQIIHLLAHEMPKRFDTFADMLHQHHLMAEYPATQEYPHTYRDMDEVFERVLKALDGVQDALFVFRAKAEDMRQTAMALFSEERMLENSESRTRFLELWALYDDPSVSASSFDSWARNLEEGGEGE